MHQSLIVAIALVALPLAVAGCEREGDAEAAPQAATTTAATAGSSGHAPQGFEPGSHEDWCGEHQVPESQCTRCNASLIPAFKATGDWCDEHGLPESQCLACNPDLEIKRPPPTEGS